MAVAGIGCRAGRLQADQLDTGRADERGRASERREAPRRVSLDAGRDPARPREARLNNVLMNCAYRLGPMNSSSLATESRRAMEMDCRFMTRHSMLSASQVSQKIRLMSSERFVNSYRTYS